MNKPSKIREKLLVKAKREGDWNLKNIQVSWLFEEMARLLELKGANPYKIRAYRNGARSLKRLQADLSSFNSTEQLTTIKGIGKGLAGNIQEILETGKFEELENLRREIPSGLKEILTIPGVGPKLARRFWQDLNITDLAGLESAAKAKKLRLLPNVGSRTELNIKREIQIMRSMKDKIPLTIIIPLLEDLIGELSLNPKIRKIEPVGELRRRNDVASGLDLMIVTDYSEDVKNFICKLPQFKREIESSKNYFCFYLQKGVKVSIWLVSSIQQAMALFYLTGNKEHVNRILSYLNKRGFNYLDYCLLKNKQPVLISREEEIYQMIGLPFIPPELRENKGEIEAALDDRLPELVSTNDVLGDLHVHSSYSDGNCKIEQLVERAVQKGYQYIAICDHSRSLTVANGLSVERLLEQRNEIKRINERLEQFTVLCGVEADILADGSLDYPDEILKQLDLVIASIHSGFKQDQEKMTKRIVSAMRNKYVNIIGHPTGRIIGRRLSYEVDLNKLLSEAKKTGTVLEVNASLDRLDLNDELVRSAGEMGIPIAINTDAHDLLGLDKMEFGVATARRGWRTRDGVINTLPIEKIKKVLIKK